MDKGIIIVLNTKFSFGCCLTGEQLTDVSLSVKQTYIVARLGDRAMGMGGIA